MIRWLIKIIIGRSCEHQWKIINFGNRTSNEEVVGKWYVLQCNKCGDIKSENF